MKILRLLFVFLICYSCITEQKKETLEANKELVNSIQKMYELDQYVSGMPQGKHENDWKGWFAYRDSISKQHKIKLEQILDEHGYPGFSMVGDSVSKKYWNMVQHCDFDVQFQKRALDGLMKRIEQNDGSKKDYAFLSDRIRINTNKEQLYGTQVKYNMEKCKVFPERLADSTNVDLRRAKMDLEPLSEYLNFMLSIHFEVNREHYNKIGIMKPNYY